MQHFALFSRLVWAPMAFSLPKYRLQPADVSAGSPPSQRSSRGKMDTKEFFTAYGEANRYSIKEVIGKGSYGVVCSALDTKTGEKVAIKKINNVFDHVSDATRILREIKLLRLLRHPGTAQPHGPPRCTAMPHAPGSDCFGNLCFGHADIVEIKHIMLPPSPREFKDIYVVFELMETDLHQVLPQAAQLPLSRLLHWSTLRIG